MSVRFRRQKTKNDCWETCLSIITKVPREEVPTFSGPRWSRSSDLWLKKRGFKAQEFWPLEYPRGYSILVVKLPSKIYHAVIARNGKIYFDQGGHDSRNGWEPKYFVKIRKK